MGLELFNKTPRIKELPKYNYNGKFKLGPNGTYPIKDYMVPFYKPYERVGVIVRHSSNEEEVIEIEVKKVLDEVRKEDKVQQEVKQVDTTVEDNVDIKPVLPEVTKTETVLLNTEDTPVENKITYSYTEDQLTEMKMEALKKIMSDLNIDPQTVKYKKSEYIQAILNAQK